MKIQGPNPYLQIYNQQKQSSIRKKSDQRTDQLNISPEAKMMQMKQTEQSERAQYVQELKEKVQSGTYEINYEQVAEKMIDYWKWGK
ncbi:flagellar biosynthesis anti-sigma factor FlgM [Pseudogracilibacillus sp. ICA-222130]|uniref:flagellar biosynthesis anti-sigma factor FlgM n=1 Tax=Pseudogracilibacillus sp. ICA-222130 TaxID=3134655 RepID=UPI0030BEFC00